MPVFSSAVRALRQGTQGRQQPTVLLHCAFEKARRMFLEFQTSATSATAGCLRFCRVVDYSSTVVVSAPDRMFAWRGHQHRGLRLK